MQNMKQFGTAARKGRHHHPVQVQWPHRPEAGSRVLKNGYSFSGSKVDRAFSYSKLDGLLAPAQASRETIRPESLNGLKTALGDYFSAFRQSSFPAEECGSIPLGGETLSLPPLSAGIGISPEELQRCAGESAEEHTTRITALFRKAAEMMLCAIAEQKRREEEYHKPKMKLRM